MRKNYSSLLVFLFFASSISAQVVINEYSASNLNGFMDSFERTEDWIELYNTSDVEIDLGGWYLSDKADNPQKWQIPSNTFIPANGFLVFYCSGRGLKTTEGELHTNFKLAQTEGDDQLVLSDAGGALLETQTLELTLVEHSRSRVVDGANEWMVQTLPTLGATNMGGAMVKGYTATPNMDLAAGFHDGPQMVAITNNEPNSILRYTTDGTNPTPDSPEYVEPIEIIETQVVKAQAFSLDSLILPGKMDFNTYFIDEDFSLVVFSVAADEVIDLANGNGPLIPIGSLEYFDLNKERVATSFGSLNRHGQDSWALDHRSLDWVSRDEMGYSKAVNAPLFGYSERDQYQKFMFRNSGDDNYPAIDDFAHQGSTHIRDEFVHTLGQLGDMELDQRAVERVILFLNGQYWGVYGMRERPVDHDYTKEYYDQDKYDVQYLSTWDRTEIEYGGIEAIRDWENLRNFILDNDMSVPENYQIAEDSINMTSLIDYMVMNLNVVASDWLNYNTGWWRGLNPEGKHKKWGYILWDLDATFDYYINYSGVPNIAPDAVPCDLEEISDFMDGFFGTETTNHGDPESDTGPECLTIENATCPYPATDEFLPILFDFNPGCCDTEWTMDCQNGYNFISQFEGGFFDGYSGNVGRHEKIFLKLLDENPDFQKLYYSRYADLMNTVFTCDNMITLLDSMLAVIEPEMPRQIERWGGSMTEWESNVNDLKDFINQRCMLLGEGALECYDELSGPYTVTLMTEPNIGIGEIDFNTLDIESFPWTGDYFGGMENDIKARVFDEYEDDYEFSHWVSSGGNVISPDEFTRRATINLTSVDTLTAVFVEAGSVSTTEIDDEFNFKVYPNPAKDFLILDYELGTSADLKVALHSVLGEKITNFPVSEGNQITGKHSIKLPLNDISITSGLYFLVIDVADVRKNLKIEIIE